MKFSAVLGLALAFSMSAGAQADDLKSLSSIKLNVRVAEDIGVMTKSCGLALVSSGLEGVVALLPVGSLSVKGIANHWQFGSDSSVYGEVLDQRTAEYTGVPANSKASPSWIAGSVGGGVLTLIGVVLDGGYKEVISGQSDAMKGAFAVVIENQDAYFESKDSVCGQAYEDFKAISAEKASRSGAVARYFKSIGNQMANNSLYGAY